MMKPKRGTPAISNFRAVLLAIKWVFIICLCLFLVLAALIGSQLLLPSPFPIETRVISKNGKVSYKSEKFSRFDADVYLDGMEKFAGPDAKPTRMIFTEYSTFLFTDDGMVYSLAYTEGGVPCAMIENWKWTGDPHQFPYLDKEYPLPGP